MSEVGHWPGFCEPVPVAPVGGGNPVFEAHVSCDNCGFEASGPMCADGYMIALEEMDYRQTADCLVCNGVRTFHFRRGDPLKGEPAHLWYCDNGCSPSALRKELLASGSACGCKGAKCLGDYGLLPDRTALYRMYNGAGLLLYIGISKDFGNRWKQHAQSKPWYLDVEKQEVEWFSSRVAALAAEEAAIKAERPVYNVMHAPSQVPPAFARKGAQARRCALPVAIMNRDPCGLPVINGICGRHGNVDADRIN